MILLKVRNQLVGTLLACGLVVVPHIVMADDAAVLDTLSVRFMLPDGVQIAEVIAGTADSLHVGNHALLGGAIATVSGDTKVGSQAQVGATTSGGNVQLEVNALVDGDLVTAGLLKTKKGASVIGSVNEGASLGAPSVIEWMADVPDSTLGPVNFEPDELRDLEPAIYGSLTLQPRAQLILHSGVYVFDNIMVQPGAELIIEDSDGPVQIYIHGGLSYNGVVRSAYQRTPQLLVVAQGSSPIKIQTAFTGVLVAPRAEIRVNSGLPDGHRAAFYSDSIRMMPDTIVRLYPFDWAEIAGIDLQPDVEGEIPLHEMPNSPADLNVGVNGDGDGSNSASGASDDPLIFTLPDSYPVAGGIIANGTVTFEFWTPDGVLVTCIYDGGSSTATPEDEEELTLGRLLIFRSCSDGLPADSPREGNHFDLSVQPVPGYPVNVRSPVIADGYCSDEMELISPQRTRNLRTAFRWSDAVPVQERNLDGRHALYYAWVFVRNPDELAAVRKLYIHRLNAPLFTAELDAFAGRCGTFTNPGDGEGSFIPVVIPGITYNRLIDALTNDEIEGDRVIFDAVILRTVPAAARNSNGSIRLDVLAESGFRYLDYEPHPLPGWERLDLAGGAAKALVDALTWIGEGLRDIGEEITNTLAALDRLFRDEVTMTMHLHAITGDSNFGSDNPIMIRGWGSSAGRPLGASGLEVTIMQRLFDSPIPTTSQGSTNSTGRSVIDAVKDGDARGSGLCVELKNRAARVTDFLLATRLCDLRGFNPDQTNIVGNFELTDFSASRELDVHIANLRFVGLYQADDVFRYSRSVMRYKPRRARIMSGYWADTFSSTNDDGSKRLYAPCLGYPNTVTDSMIAASFTAGVLAGLAIPGGSLITGTVAATFASIIGVTDIVMSTNSALAESREVMSHEYGHFLFCSTMFRANPFAIDHLAWTIIAAGDDLTVPTRYLHEGMADYFTGQVAGGNDYRWLDNTTGGFCDGRSNALGEVRACWDSNEREVSSGVDDRDSIGRIASMVHDAFDGHGAARRASVPGDGDVWFKKEQLCIAAGDPWACCSDAGEGSNTEPCNLLEYSPTGYGNLDFELERVALEGRAFLTFASGIAAGLGPFTLGFDIDDTKIFGALNGAMASRGETWCDRCRVLALHSETDPGDRIGELFLACNGDPVIVNAMGPAPEPNLRLDAASCTPCPDNFFSNEDGVCEQCDDIVIGNTCTTIPPIE